MVLWYMLLTLVWLKKKKRTAIIMYLAYDGSVLLSFVLEIQRTMSIASSFILLACFMCRSVILLLDFSFFYIRNFSFIIWFHPFAILFHFFPFSTVYNFNNLKLIISTFTVFIIKNWVIDCTCLYISFIFAFTFF